MDTSALAARLDDQFLGDPAEGRPADDRLTDVTTQVAGYTTPAELAVLKAAVEGLPADEAYLEVGTFKGRSLCGAFLDPIDRTVYAIENFEEFGMAGAEARAELYANLDRYVRATDFRLLEGDCFAVLARPDALDRPVGVYFYDGAHTSLVHYLALGVVEPHLADEALVLVDDATWPVVRKATMAYVARHPGWSVVRSFDAASDHDDRWANGLLLLRYRREGRPRVHARDVRILLQVQRRVVGPLFAFAWKVVPRSRLLTSAATKVGRLLLGRSHRVPDA